MAKLDETLDLVVQRTGSTSGTPRNEAEAAGYRAGIKLDIASIMNQMNSVYYPLLNTLSKETGIDALELGLSGNVVYTNINATAADPSAYWNATLSRQRTIKETIDVLLTEISELENSIDFTVDVSAYDDTEVRGLVGNNQLNLKQLRLDTVGDTYTFDNDGAADNTYSLSQAVDAIGAFFTGFPGTGNTYTPTYPTLQLNVLLSQVTIDTTIPITAVTNLATLLSNIATFVGMDDPNDTTPDYSVHGAVLVVSDGDSLELAIQKLDAQVSLASGAFSTATNITSNSPGDYTSDDFVFGSPSLDDDTIVTHDSRMYFDKSKSAFRAGKVTGTDWDSANAGVGSVAFGVDNRASGLGAGTLAGSENEAAAEASVVAGGGGAALGNTITSTSERSFIGAGEVNTITNSDDAVIGGGGNNSISGLSHRSVIAGGGGIALANGNIIANSPSSAILGGSNNDINPLVGLYNTIGGGFSNAIGVTTDSISWAGIFSGELNIIKESGFSGNHSGIFSGYSNLIFDASDSTICGGRENQIDQNATSGGSNCFIGGGGGSTVGNKIQNGNKNAIVCGESNTINAGSWNLIGGGGLNTVSGTTRSSVIAGGDSSTVSSSDWAVIAGGQTNAIATSSTHAAIGGGQGNSIGGTAASTHSVIGGGKENSIDDSAYSVICGGGFTSPSNNRISNSDFSFIGGGVNNDILGIASDASNFIGGGTSITIGEGVNSVNDNAVVCGDTISILNGDRNFIGSGANLTITGSDYSIITGGARNTITGSTYCFIGGGGDTSVSNENTITNATHSVITGGMNNDVDVTSGGKHFIGGGDSNAIGDGADTGSGNTLVGGLSNSIVDGNQNFIGGGANNDISSGGNYNVIAGGTTNVIDVPTVGHGVICGGNSNSVDAEYGAVLGGQSNTVTGTYAAAMGKSAAAVHDYGFTQSNTTLSDTHYVIWSATTTNATPEELFLDGDAGSARYDIADDDRSGFVIYVNAAEQNTNEVAMYKFEGLIRRDGIASTTTLVFANKTILHEDNASLDFNISADTTNGALKLEATGIAAETWIWHATGIMNHIAS